MSEDRYIVGIIIVLLFIMFVFRKPRYNSEDNVFIDASGSPINGSIDLIIDGVSSSHSILKGIISDGVDFSKASRLTIYNKKGEILYYMEEAA